MKNKISTMNVIKAKLKRPDFLVKIILSMLFFGINLHGRVDYLLLYETELGKEKGNILMYLLYAFTNSHIIYYVILMIFAIVIADIVYEEYLTKTVYIMYGSRKKAYVGMLKLVLSFALIFISLYLLLAVIIGICSGLDLSFGFAEKSILAWEKEQDFSLIRSTPLYIPASVLKYNSFVVLGIVLAKFYVGLVLFSMIGLMFSIKKDSVQHGVLAMILTDLLNVVVLNYYGPWNFYKIGISIDLSVYFKYLTLQRFFIYDFAGIKKDVVELFGSTMLTGCIWFVVLSVIIYRILKKKDI